MITSSFVVAITLILLLILLIQNRVKPAFLFFGLALFYYFIGYISLDSMLKGFINPSLITLMLLLTISIVFEKTSFISTISNKVFSKSYTKSILKMSFFTSLFSAFLNNTAVVASMISVVKQNRFHNPSKLLLPLSYAAIFGGTITLIGTSTNLLVNSFVIQKGLEPLSLFDFVYVGVFIASIGTIVLLFSSKFLPNIQNEQNYESYFIEAKVLKESKLIGKSVEKNRLRHLEYLFLSEILRDGQIISPVNPSEIIQEDDILLFSGDIKKINILKQFDKLEIESKKHEQKEDEFLEVIVSNQSILINKTIKETNFRSKFNASVIAIKRGSQNISGKLSDIKIQAGDKLVLVVGKDFYKRDNIKKNFYIVSQVKTEDKLTKNQSFLVLAGFISVLVGSFFELFPLVKGLFALLVFYVGFGFLKVDEIKRRFSYDLMLIIASALSIATVMSDSGLGGIIGSFMQSNLQEYGVYVAFVGVYLLTLVLTELITNNAAAALSFPIAYSTAMAFDSSMMPFIMAVAYGASASFLMPFGYQTNLMVYSVGGYDIKTFLRSGIFVSLIYSIIVVSLVPIFFPF